MKNVLKIVGVIFCLGIVSLFFVACNNSLQEEVSKNISEYREDFFFASDDNYIVSFTDGKREKDFITNGDSTSLVDFGVLLLKSKQDLGNKPKFKLTINDKVYEGDFERNPFDNTYVVDLQVRVNKEDNILFELPEMNVKMQLLCLSKNWQIDVNKALNIFIDYNEQKLSTYLKNKDFKGEIFIKIVSDKHTAENIYWYVLCICEDGNVFSNLISVENGEILQS